MANASATELQQLYIAYFGRAADPTGLDYWTDKGITTKAFAANMYAQNEFKSVYGDLSTESQVNQIYQNLFDRDADATGLLYWSKQIKNGTLELASIANDLIWAANNNSGSADDKTALTNKSNAAVAYTAKVRETTSAILAYSAESTSPWVSGVNITEAVSYFSGIDKDTVHTTAGIASSVSTISTNGVQSTKDASQAFSLTIGNNSFTGKGSGDTFDASLASSLDTADVIDGKGGTDTLSATLAAESIRPTIKNVEKINFTATADTLNVDTRDITGVTTYTVESSAGAVKFNNLATIPDFANNSGTAAVTINFQDSALSGSADNLTISLNNLQQTDTTNDVIEITDAGGTNKLETLTIDSTSLSSTIDNLATTAVGTTTLSVTGDEALKITDALDAEIATISAAAFTGGLTATVGITTGATITTGSGNDVLTGAAGNDSFTTGAGDDTISPEAGTDTVSAGAGNDTIKFDTEANMTKVDTIDGGAGTDAIEYTADTTATDDEDFTLVTNVEQITSSTGIQLAAVTLGAKAEAAGINEIIFADAGKADKVTVGADFTTDLTVTLSSDAIASDIVDATNYTGALTVKVGSADIDTRDTVLTGGKGTSDKLVYQLGAADDTATATTLASVTAFETLEIVDVKPLANHTFTVTIDEDAWPFTSSTDYVSFTIDASSIGASGDTVNIDGSDNTASDSLGKLTIKGGDGVNTITISKSANFGDTITAGGGNDTIKAAAGADLTATDSIDAGAGTDTLTFVDDSTVTDAQFTLVTNLENISGSAAKHISATLDTKAAAAGVTGVTFLDTGANDSLTLKAGFTNDITVTLDDLNNTQKNTVDASLYGGSNLIVKDTVAFMDNAAGTADSVITGSANLNDIYEVSIDAAATTKANDTITKFETFKITDGETTTNRIAKFVLADGNVGYTNSSTYETVTIDATAIGASGDTISIDASAEQDGKLIIKGGDGVNTITISQSANFGDTITAGAGNDTISLAAASHLTKDDSIDGGTGDNTISLAAAGTIKDAAFTGVTNIKTLTSAANEEYTGLTLGAEAAEAGITNIILAGANAAETVTIGSGFTNDISIELDEDGSGTNTITATAYTKSLTLTGISTDFQAKLTSTGGTGSDTLKITSSGADATLNLDSVTKFETVSFVDDSDGTAHTFALTTDSDLVADGATFTVDASALVTDDATVSFLADTDGNNVYKGGPGVDTVTGSASDLGDNFSGGASVDVFKFATANLTSLDTIDGGAGNDQLSMTDAATIVDADFTNVTSLEEIKGAGALTITLGALAQAAGVTTLTTTGSSTGTYTLGADYTNDISIALGSSSTDSITATAYTGTLTVTGDVDELGNGVDTISGGTTGTTILKFNGNGGTFAAADTGITGVDKMTLGVDADYSITTAEVHVADSATLTIDALKLTTKTLTFVGSAENDGNFIINATGNKPHDITLGQGNDTYSSASTGGDIVVATAGNNTISTGDGVDKVTGGTGADNITGGAGADEFTFVTANLDSNDTVDGGAGNDKLLMSADGVFIDADFTNISNVEIIDGASATTNLTATLGTNAASAGITTFNFSDTGAAESLTVAAGFDKNLTVVMDATKGNTVSASNYTKNLTVTTGITDMDDAAEAHTLTGGSGTDTLEITHTESDNPLLTNVTKFETIKLITDGLSAWTSTVTTADTLVAKDATLTIDGEGLATGTQGKLVFDGSAEKNGNFTIKVKGTAAHTATLGEGNDTFTDTGSGAVEVTANKGNNTITTGTGANKITSGSGTDIITGGTGADTFIFESAANSFGDSILDFKSADDQIQIKMDVSSFATAQTINAVRVTEGVAGVATGESSLTGKKGEYFYDTTNSKLVIDLTGDGTISGADHNFSVNAATTAKDTIAASDLNFVITGTANGDIITTGDGADSITGGSGADTLTGGGGNDIITGSGGADTLAGGDGIDTITGGSVVDTITGGAGNDIIVGGTGADIITGGAGADAIDVTAGADIDTVIVAAGDTELTIASGVVTGFDVLTGFADGDGTNKSDLLKIVGAGIIADGTVAGDNSTLKYGSSKVIKSHKVTNGIATFDDAEIYAAALTLPVTDIALAAAVQYLQANDLGSAGHLLGFAHNSNIYVFAQGSDAGTDNTLDMMVQVPSEASTLITATNSKTAHLLGVVVS